MICNVLCVGTELLLGQIDDTNSAVIGRELADGGIMSIEHRRVGDNPERIFSALTDMLKTSDAIIVTGGLGPTHDDITREVTAKVMGVELEKNKDVVAHIESIFDRRGRTMSENNLRQAMVPVGATIIENPLGTAPGLICPVGDKNVYLVPGVPHEMSPMITNVILPHLHRGGKSEAIVTRTIKTWGIPESTLAEMLDEFVREGETSDVKVGFLARGINGIYVKLSARAHDKREAQDTIRPVENDIVKLLGDAVYAFDDETMESIVIDLLSKKSLTLAVAESLTGGMVSSRLVDVPGSSKVLRGCVVSYATDIKHDALKVTADDVYSHECAEQMASGVKELLGADFGISTTGVAGPDEDQGHPPGEVFVGISSERATLSEQFLLGGDRKRVREYTTITALNFLRRYLLDLEPDNRSSE